MKRTITILLMAVLLLSMAACSSGNGTTTQEATSMTKDEMLEVAENINLTDVVNAFSENKARAEQTYLDNIYTISALVYNIESDYCTIECTGNNGDKVISVYLDKSELALLNSGEMITVVGKISKTDNYFKIDNAFYVGNTIEITGTLKIEDTYITYQGNNGRYVEFGSPKELYCYIVDDNGNTYKINDEDISSISNSNVTILDKTINNGDSITIDCKVISDSQHYYSHGEGSKSITFDYSIEEVSFK